MSDQDTQRTEDLAHVGSRTQLDPQATGGQNQPAPTWQLIETAPKNGTEVLVWKQSVRDEAYASGYYNLATWDPVCEAWLVTENIYCDSPTHWMPLPHPPA